MNIIEGKLKELSNNIPRSQMLLVGIVKDSAKAEREYVKWWGEVRTGVPTQVLVRDSDAIQDRLLRVVVEIIKDGRAKQEQV